MDFLQSFGKGLIKDLEDGKYGSADDFAKGITKHYVGSLKFNAPNSIGSPYGPALIPPTLPSPTALGAPAPVGPTISYKVTPGRRKLFYNTVRLYYIGKEISRGKVQVKALAQDVRRGIILYKKTKREIQTLRDEIDNVRAEIEGLKEDLKNIKPEFKKFIDGKKQILKDFQKEIRETGARFSQLTAQQLSQFDYNTVLADEINDLNFFLNLDLKPSIDFTQVRATLEALINLVNKSSTTITKYKNIFTKEANFKIYIRKKFATVIRELFDLLNAFVAPEKFIRLWKDLLYVPNGKRIAQIMLKIIERNVFLKQKKKKLIQKFNEKRKVVLDQINKKIDTATDKLKEQADYLSNRMFEKRKNNKFLERLKSSKTLRNTIKRVKRLVKYVKNWIKHIVKLLKTVFDIITRVFAIYTAVSVMMKDAKVIAEKIKQRYRELDAAVQASRENIFTPGDIQLNRQTIDAAGGSVTKSFLDQLGADIPLISQIIQLINDTLKFKSTQLTSFLRVRFKNLQVIVSSLDTLLVKDIPKLSILIKSNPNSSNYKEKLAKVNQIQANDVAGAATVYSKDSGGYTYLYVMKLIRKILLKLKKSQNQLLSDLDQKQNELKDTAKDQDALTAYIDTLFDKKPKLKKIRNKKRRIKQKADELKIKTAKLRSIAKQVRIGFRIIDGVTNIVLSVDQDKRRPVTNNEINLKKVYTAILDLQIERKKLATKQKKPKLKKFNNKILDLKSYEFMYNLFIEVLKEGKLQKMRQEVEKELQNQQQQIDKETKNSLNALLALLDGTKGKPSMRDIAQLSANVVTQANVVTAFVRAEKRLLKRIVTKVQSVPEFIREDTSDPLLRKIRLSLEKATSIFLWLFQWVKDAYKAMMRFIMNELLKPVEDYIKKEVTEVKEKITERARIKIENESKRKLNIEGRIATAMFGIASRLLWTGASWTNPVGTKFIVLNVGKFRPKLVMTNIGGAQSFGEGLASGFNAQLKSMTGLVIPVPSYGIPPFTFNGYVSLQAGGPSTPASVINERRAPDPDAIQYA